MSKAIIVVSFGTTYPETRKKTIQACEEAIQKRFPDFQVYRAFTSNVVIKRIKKNEGITVPTVNQLLEQLKKDGVKEVYIQPLHVILGSEYEKVLHQANQLKHEFDILKIGKPLLFSEEDYERVGDILVEEYGQYDAHEATILMGHGSQHYAFTAYAALDHMLMDTPVYIGCVESYPPVEDLEKRLEAKGIKKVHLAPFMLVAGDHATNDLCSDEEGSWKHFFTEKGYQVETHLIGLGEYPSVQELYVQHLEQIIQ